MLQVRVGDKYYSLLENMENYFLPFRENIIGANHDFKSPYGRKKLLYADWTASGRLYAPIENRLIHEIGPFFANTHTEDSFTGSYTTKCYIKAKEIIKQHVNADEQDVLIMTGAGMTSAVNKLQRILGLRVQPNYVKELAVEGENKPVIFISHMEHHSNYLSWLETVGEVCMLPPGLDGKVDANILEKMLEKYKNRKVKIGSFTACSNVTGIETDYHQLARIMHQYNGFCFVDFAASAPYVDINMHPKDPQEKLDAIFFSPHKFLGGPGTAGVLIFDSRLYKNTVPDHPGGGTVSWTNPWSGRQYWNNIESREDGGTPGILQTIKTAMCIQLKEHMGTRNILLREKEQLKLLFEGLDEIPELHILDGENRDRLGIVSFIVKRMHYNLIVKLLNDRFGIQARGGCSCAGPYGHYLLGISKNQSKKITDAIDQGELSKKPGWIRISIHPTMSNQEILFINQSIKEVITNYDNLKRDYVYNQTTNSFSHKKEQEADTGKLFVL